MHYNTFPPIVQDGEAFKRTVETGMPGVQCFPLKPGEQRQFGS
jgi:L-ascorbate metabolism protein UlaG (beta-lactamase superfamily)